MTWGDIRTFLLIEWLSLQDRLRLDPAVSGPKSVLFHAVMSQLRTQIAYP